MPFISNLLAFVRRLTTRAGFAISRLWARFRALRPVYQWVIAIALVVLIILLATLRGGADDSAADSLPAVSIEAVGTLSGGDGASSFFGSVESVSEAEVLAKTSGTVTRVNVRVGQTVGAGTVLASLENASEAASVLSAQGAYEAALASRTTSTKGTAADVESTYDSARLTFVTAVDAYIAPLFSNPRGDAKLLLQGQPDYNAANRFETLWKELEQWRFDENKGVVLSPTEKLKRAEGIAESFSALITDLALIANRESSNATATERANINSARTSIENLKATLRDTRLAYEAGQGNGSVSASDASVKQALGALRSAQAAFERTVVRAPIAGTVNFLPIKVGDYVTAMTHAATVARNGALEITAYVSPESREALSIGAKVVIDEKAGGTITSIAPALDPVTKQIEVRIAADNASTLVNGQSVRVRLASAPKTETPKGPLMLPLSSVKLAAGSRVIFSVGEDNRLIAHEVEIGDVRGDRIEITTALPLDLRIVRDARGLSAGQEVRIATSAN